MASACSRFFVTSVIGMALVSPAAAQTPLPMGAPAKGQVPNGGAAEYTLVAKTAGVLVAAVKGDDDLVIHVTDTDGQTIPEGRSDRDLNGSAGTELVSVVIPEPGNYRVRVTTNGGGGASFEISGSWMSFPPFAQASTDPDRRPGAARTAQVGKAIEDSINAQGGDAWDWFVLKPAQAGTLVIVTRKLGDAQADDLVLEAYLDGNYAQPAQRSDQDLQGNSANESVTLQVNAGQAVHVKVAGNFSSVNTKYRLSSNLVP
jgi:hypothetical protein